MIAVVELKYHPYVYFFPRLNREEFEYLKKDIVANGQGIPITVLVGTNLVIDGRHRYEICCLMGIEPKIEYVTLAESQILWKVLSLNIRRRHLSESQRAAIAARIANLHHGGHGNNQSIVKKSIAEGPIGSSAIGEKISLQEAAEVLNVGRSAVVRAKATIHSFPEVVEHIIDGRVTVFDAHKIKDESPEIKREAIARFCLDLETGRRTKKLAQYRKEIKQEVAKKTLERAVNTVLGIEVDETPRVNFGDTWQLGLHTLRCCDSSIWNAPQAKLAIADPPYNAGMADWDLGFEWKHDWLIENAKIVIVTPGDESFAHFLRKTNMPYKCMIAHWIQNGMSKSQMGYGNHIIAAVFCNESTPYKATGKRNQNYSQSIIKAVETDECNHPGRKPLDFILTWIDRLTKPGEVVIDPFLGSGTTLIAAEQVGRICHGAEINPEYCGSILGRWIKSGKENPKRIKTLVDV